MLWQDRVLTGWPGGRCESLDLFWGSDVGQVVSSSGQGLDIVLLSILLARLRKSDWGWGRGVKNLCNGWSKQFFLENMVVLNFDFRNRGHLVHPFQSYGRIYFNIFQQKLDDIGWHQGTSKTKTPEHSEQQWPTYKCLKSHHFTTFCISLTGTDRHIWQGRSAPPGPWALCGLDVRLKAATL